MPKRESIHIPGVTHGKAPIPMGAKVGSFVCSSAIMGKDASTDELPEDKEEQMKMLFENIRLFMKEAGGSTENIVKFTVYLSDNSLRDAFNAEWLEMFPDPDNRPARHITLKELRRGMAAQVELTAVV